jgi:release factor glutamine methyltransferase
VAFSGSVNLAVVSGARAQRKAVALQLARAGFPAAKGEARDLFDAAWGDPDIMRCWAARRLDGEPLEWLRGFTIFSGQRVRVDRGVYVPRPQTELLVGRAIALLPEQGLAADLCTGSGAIAVALRAACPGAHVVATDIDANAVRCAAKNEVEVYQGHLAEPVPLELVGRFDVVVAVVPYVPTDEVIFLPRDVRRYEPLKALDGGIDGVTVLKQVIGAGRRLLHSGGSLLLELGGSQDAQVGGTLEDAGFNRAELILDDEGDLRGLHAKLK